MTERSQNLLVGITAMAGLVCFCILLMMVGSFKWLTERGYETYVIFDEAGGLNPNSRVRVSGIDIGRVDRLELTPDNRVMIVCVIDDKRKDITYDVSAAIYQPLIGGSPALIIEPSHRPKLPAGKATLGDHTAQDPVAGVMPVTIADAIAQFKDVAGSINGVTVKIGKLSDELSDLMQNRSLDEVKADPTKANLRTVIQRLDSRLAELEGISTDVQKILDSANALVNDPKTQSNIRDALAHANSFAGKLDSAGDKYSALATDAQAHIDELTKRYILVADDLSATLHSAQKTLDLARDGKGTTGKLINDPALYDNLNDAVKRVDAAVNEMRLLVAKWKAEGLPVKF